jgi:hypothetical protein
MTDIIELEKLKLQFRLEAEAKANAMADLRIKQEAEKLAKDRDQAKIHNEILKDLKEFLDTEKEKELIKAIIFRH